jgi:hypothetical protein
MSRPEPTVTCPACQTPWPGIPTAYPPAVQLASVLAQCPACGRGVSLYWTPARGLELELHPAA